MAHYALLDENNIVVQVIVGKNEDELDNDGNVVDWELHYSQSLGKRCLRTSYNTFGNEHFNNGIPFRGNYAGIGYKYDQDFDAFIPPKTYPSWKLNYQRFLWEAPIPKPPDEEGFVWRWSESNQEWIKLAIPTEEE